MRDHVILWGPVLLVAGQAMPKGHARTVAIVLGSAGSLYAAYAAYRRSVLGD